MALDPKLLAEFGLTEEEVPLLAGKGTGIAAPEETSWKDRLQKLLQGSGSRGQQVAPADAGLGDANAANAASGTEGGKGAGSAIGLLAMLSDPQTKTAKKQPDWSELKTYLANARRSK